tara:strand:- start:2711 stop:2950 length:240 start_codon:yes stop_codon:yes gene_type:complete
LKIFVSKTKGQLGSLSKIVLRLYIKREFEFLQITTNLFVFQILPFCEKTSLLIKKKLKQPIKSCFLVKKLDFYTFLKIS